MKVNKEQKLYVFEFGNGFSCLGFNVLDKRARALAAELQEEWKERKGTKKAYFHYQELTKKASHKNRITGWKSKSQLHPQLIGLEHMRVEVIDQDGERYRFNVGKSTGFIPCHLQLHNSVSSGGSCVDSRPFKSVRVI